MRLYLGFKVINMRAIKILGFFFLISFAGFGQINWQPTLAEAFKQAKVENKLVLVECFHPQCSHCISLNQNLDDPEIQRVLNEKYINYRIDISNRIQYQELKDRNISLIQWPVFLVFNKEDSLTNYVEPTELLASLKLQLANVEFSSDLKCDRVGIEEPNIDLLSKCGVYYRMTQNIEKNNEMANYLYFWLNQENIGSEKSWMVYKKSVSSSDNLLAQFWLQNLSLATQYEKSENVAKEIMAAQLQTKMISLYKSDKLTPQDVVTLKEELTKIGADETKILSFTWNLELITLIKSGDFKNAKTLCNRVVNQFPTPGAFITVFRLINDQMNTSELNSFFEENIEVLTQKAVNNQELSKELLLQSARFYSKANNLKACRESLQKAADLGFNQQQEFEEKYCR